MSIINIDEKGLTRRNDQILFHNALYRINLKYIILE
jgi:hypothetical protein